MKFATWLQNGEEIAGVISASMQTVHSFRSAGVHYANMLDFIQNHTENDMHRMQKQAVGEGCPIENIRLLAPIPRPHHDIICLGLNYMDHAEESANFDIQTDPGREDAVYFSKRVNNALGPGGYIDSHSDIMEKLDYEAELALVIGKDAKNVSRAQAWQYVFGLCCFNDISGRELQKKHKQWYFGKSLDTFTAFGPYIVTLDEFTIPLNMEIESRVNGEVRQHSTTANMIFKPDYVLEELTRGMTLEAGSIIATGTPAGVGAGFTPHRCMKPNDVVEIEITGCGVLKNIVR